MISLGLGRLDIDWGKNSYFRDHSALFLPGDIHDRAYYYADDVVETKRAYARPLQNVIRRLDMLGFTIRDCERRFHQEVAMAPDGYPTPIITFSEFRRALELVDVNALALPEDGDYDLGEFAARAILSDPAFQSIEPKLSRLGKDDGAFFENLDPYITLRLLGENKVNRELDVVWRFADVVDEGWVTEESVYEGVPEDAVCLVITEGSSDSDILKTSVEAVAPDIADFFRFIDMSENYPFTGAGNLFRFCQGLSRIRIQNRALVVLDNDTTGRETYERIRSLDLPPRMRVAILPEAEEFRAVPTLGPSGEHLEDINGRAVSIECFLDIWSDPEKCPTVRWTAYNTTIGDYQGALVSKEEYVRLFHEAVKRRSREYALGRLEHLWGHLFSVCTGAGT